MNGKNWNALNNFIKQEYVKLSAQTQFIESESVWGIILVFRVLKVKHRILIQHAKYMHHSIIF